MKIKYLKLMHNANVGDVLEVTDFEANILIKTGVAELAGNQTVDQKNIVHSIYTLVDTTGLLLNFNGTTIICDFGELIAEKQSVIEEKSKPTRKPRNKKTVEQE